MLLTLIKTLLISQRYGIFIILASQTSKQLVNDIFLSVVRFTYRLTLTIKEIIIIDIRNTGFFCDVICLYVGLYLLLLVFLFLRNQIMLNF